MKENEESGGMPAEVSSKDGPKNDVIEVFDVKVECVTSVNGSKTCKIREISVDGPSKNPASDVPAASSKKDVSVAAVPAAIPVISVPETPITAAPRELAAGSDAGCSLCLALEAALMEQVTAAAKSTPAPRRQFSPRVQSRRMSRS